MTEFKKVFTFQVGSGNFISQLFFLWVFQFILVLRKFKDIKWLILILRKSETSDYNDQILEIKWIEEKKRAKLLKVQPSIKRAIFKAFGLQFILNGVYKILWGISLWFGAYWLLKQTIALVRNITSKLTCATNLYLCFFYMLKVKNFFLSIFYYRTYITNTTRDCSQDKLTGHMYALGFLLSSIAATIFIQQLLSQSGRLGLRVFFLIYLKFLLFR
jgi:hypothetical protein